MRKLSFYLLGLVALAGVTFTSCDTATTFEEPTISVTPTTAEAAVGEDVNFTVTVAGDAELKSVSAVVDPYATFPDTTFDKGEHNATIGYIYTVPASAADGTAHTITWTVEDVEGQTKSVTATVNVVASAGPVKSFSAVLMGASGNADYGSFLGTQGTTATVYFVADAFDNQSAVDVLYYYGATNKASLAAPDDAGAAEFSVYNLANWTTKNATKFVSTTITAADFAAMTDDASFVDASSGTSSATDLSEGDVVAFYTAGGKMGLIHISSIVGDSSAGSISIDVKVQE